METLKLLMKGATLTAAVHEELDHHTAKPLREAIDERMLAVRPRELILDFSGVRFMDSSGVGLILGRVALAEEIGAQVRLVGLSPSQRKLVALSGLDKVRHLTVESKEEERI